jgi:hypothetical protein
MAEAPRRATLARPKWLRVDSDGSVRVPAEIVSRLRWNTGAYLDARIVGDTLRLERVEVDPFEEAAKAPDPGAFDRILERQRSSREEAFRKFEERTAGESAPEGGPAS